MPGVGGNPGCGPNAAGGWIVGIPGWIGWPGAGSAHAPDVTFDPFGPTVVVVGMKLPACWIGGVVIPPAVGTATGHPPHLLNACRVTVMLAWNHPVASSS